MRATQTVSPKGKARGSERIKRPTVIVFHRFGFSDSDFTVADSIERLTFDDYEK
jgi:hypothetical protein